MLLIFLDLRKEKLEKVGAPVISVKIGDHCYYGLCDISASSSAIYFSLYQEVMLEIGTCEIEDIDVVIQLANRDTISPVGIVRDVEVLLLRSNTLLIFLY